MRSEVCSFFLIESLLVPAQKDSYINRYAAPVQPVSGTTVCLYVLAVFVSTRTASPCDKRLNFYHPAPPLPSALACKENRPLFAFCFPISV